MRNGEAFAFERLSSRLNIRHQNRLLLTDNIQWQPGLYPPARIGQMEHYTHQLNLFYVHTGDTDLSAQLENLHQCLSENHAGQNPDLLWGISRSAPAPYACAHWPPTPKPCKTCCTAPLPCFHPGRLRRLPCFSGEKRPYFFA